MSANVPELRFSGFADPWEQRKLVDIALRQTVVSDDPALPTVEYEDINPGEGTLNKDLSTKATHKSGVLFNAGDILYGKLRPYLHNWLHPQFKGIAVGDFWVLEPQRIDGRFVYCLIQSGRFSTLADVSAGSKMPRADWKLISESKFSIPTNVFEQRAVGALFSRLDSLIALHQRKHNQLGVLKSSLLERMFPKPGSDVPELRFSGFADPWEQRKFSEVFSFLRNNTLSRAELSDTEGSMFNVHYGDVLVKFGEVVDANRDILPRIADDGLAARLSCPPLADGDVIIADTAEDEAVGKCSELRGCDGKGIVSGLHTIACRPMLECAPRYLGYYLNSPSFHNQLLPLMQGIKVISVSKGAIGDTEVCFPSFPEQRAVGALFSRLDSLIALHQRESPSVTYADD